jgi:hypothetical protein
MKNSLQKMAVLAVLSFALSTFATAQSCDTLSNFSGNYTPAIIPLPAPSWGYISGHNSTLDVAKAEYFNATSTGTHVNSALMGFGYAFTTNPLSTVTATVWDGTGGTPGAVLGQKAIPIAAIMSTILSFQAYEVVFDNPVPLVSSQFFIGFTMTAGADTVAMITNAPGQVPLGTGTAWERQANGNWYNYNNITNSWGFEATHAIFPILTTPPTAVVTPSNVFACANTNITFDALNSTNTATYEWFFTGGTPATATVIAPTVNYATAGSYNVTLIANGDCLSDTLVLNNAVTISTCPAMCNLQVTIAANTPTCFNGNNGTATAQILSGMMPYSFAWSNGQTTATATNLAAGNHSVTVTDANNCSIVAAFVLGNAVPITANIATTDPTICNGTNGTATLTAIGGTAPYTFAWSNGQATATALNLSQGSYVGTITDANGCTQTATALIGDGCSPCVLAVSPLVTNASCGNANGSINANASGATGTPTYAWSNGATSAVVNGLTAGTYTVTVTSGNCTQTATATVSQTGAVVIGMQPQDNFCSAMSASISTIISGGAAPYTHLWSNGATTASINNLTSGSYSVIVTDANGCAATSSAAVTSIANGPTVTATQVNISCFGANDGTVNTSINGGNLPYAVFWSPLNVSAQNLNSLAAGTYTVVVADQAGCLATTTVVITQPDSIILTTATTPTLSNTGTASVTAAGGTPPFTYLWTGNKTTQTITGLVTGTYSVTVTDAKGCSKTTTATVQDFTSNTNDIAALNRFDVFPNPSNGQFNVRLEFETRTDAQVQIFDLLGQKVFETQVNDLFVNLPIALPNASAGIYFLTVQTKSGKATKRILMSK